MAAAFVAERAKATHAATSTFGITVASITTGNLMVLALAIGAGGTTLNSVSDNGTGSTWQIDKVVASVAGSREGIALATAIAGATPPTTITITLSNGSSTFGYKVAEFSGVSAAAWLDVAASGTQASGTTTITYPNITPSTGELILAAASIAPLQSQAATAGTNYTMEGTQIGTAPEPVLEYRLSGTTSETPTATVHSSITVTAGVVTAAYKLKTSVQNNQSMTVTVTVNPSIIRQVGKAVSQTVTVNPSLIKSAAKTLAQTITATPSLLAQKVKTITMSVTVTVNGLFGPKQVGKLLTNTVTVTPSFLKTVSHAFTQTVTASPSLIKQMPKTLSQTVTAAPSVLKSVTKTLSQTLTASPTLTAHVATIHQVALSVTVTVKASVCWCIARGLKAVHAGVLAITGNLMNIVGLSTADPNPISLTPIDPGTEPISTLDPTHISDPTVEGCDCE